MSEARARCCTLKSKQTAAGISDIPVMFTGIQQETKLTQKLFSEHVEFVFEALTQNCMHKQVTFN